MLRLSDLAERRIHIHKENLEENKKIKPNEKNDEVSSNLKIHNQIQINYLINCRYYKYINIINLSVIDLRHHYLF